jgi:sulfur carrier protein ThiS
MKIKVDKDTTVEEVLRDNDINLEEVIVRKGDLILTEKDPLEQGDEIEAIRIVSGG